MQDDADCPATNLCRPMKCVDELCVFDLAAEVTCSTAGDTSCTETLCDPTAGECITQSKADGVECDDGDVCSTSSNCALGICVGTNLQTCDDGNPCTDDSCAAGQGCVYLPQRPW